MGILSNCVETPAATPTANLATNPHGRESHGCQPQSQSDGRPHCQRQQGLKKRMSKSLNTRSSFVDAGLAVIFWAAPASSFLTLATVSTFLPAPLLARPDVRPASGLTAAARPWLLALMASVGGLIGEAGTMGCLGLAG